MVKGVLYVLAFIYALMDAQSIVSGAGDGLQLAITVVVPSLFPFIFLSTLSAHSIGSRNITVLRPLEKLCGMPIGSGSLLLLGLCGGYPVGAQCVARAYTQGTLTKQDAQRLLGFCNNAGPSFIFGMVGGILKDIRLCWFLWLGQILSAILVGAILPGKSAESCRLTPSRKNSVTQTLESTVYICSKIAGWVILFRVALSVAEKWFLHRLPVLWCTAVAGLLELSNGCVRLQYIDTEWLRFLLCGAMLAFGGICVHLQTKSVVGSLSIKFLLLGKVMQTLLALPILFVLWKIIVAF